VELYNLADDPQERANLASDSNQAMKQLDVALARWVTLQQKYYDGAYYLRKASPDHCGAVLSAAR
jgi:hypothetical protein